jgi:hypothetical protein
LVHFVIHRIAVARSLLSAQLRPPSSFPRPTRSRSKVCIATRVYPQVVRKSKGEEEMQVFVKGVSSTFAVELEASATVADLKAAIEDHEFIPAGTFLEIISL